MSHVNFDNFPGKGWENAKHAVTTSGEEIWTQDLSHSPGWVEVAYRYTHEFGGRVRNVFAIQKSILRALTSMLEKE